MVARGQNVVYEVTISVVVVAKGVAVVLWVRVQGQLVIVRVVAWVSHVSWEISCRIACSLLTEVAVYVSVPWTTVVANGQ